MSKFYPDTKYAKSPIIEAVCEFRFLPDSSWDITVPGLVYEQIRDIFPKRRQAKQVIFNVSSDDSEVTQQVQSIDVMQFLEPTEINSVQVGPHLVRINHLRPYSEWSRYIDFIRQGYDAYCQVARPVGIYRIGLRYINRILLGVGDLTLANYLNFRPHWSPAIQEIKSFLVGIEMPFDNDRDILRMQLVSATPEQGDEGHDAVILDLDYFVNQPGSVNIENALDWVANAHIRVQQAFEETITDQLRISFEPQKG